MIKNSLMKIVALVLLSLVMMSSSVIAQEQSEAAQEQSQTQESNSAEAAVEDNAANVSESDTVDTVGTVENLDANRTVLSPDAINPIELSYKVSGENSTFLSDIEDAFMTWQSASVGAIEASQSASATLTFVPANDALLGPDVMTLKVKEQNLISNDVSAEQARLTTTILVNEVFRESPNLYKSALLHEVGVLVGIPLSASGVMQRGLTELIEPSVSLSEARALEVQASAAKEDVNRDGVVDFYDLVELAKNHSEFPQNFSADITGDGKVDAEDVNALQAAYTFSDPVNPEAATDESQQTTTQVQDSSQDSSQGSVSASENEQATNSEGLSGVAREMAARAEEFAQQNRPEDAQTEDSRPEDSQSGDNNQPQNTDEQ